MRPEPRWISYEVLGLLYERQVELFGGSPGILDDNVVRSALARPQNVFHYVPEADLFDLAAAYLCGFAQKQGFTDGNKRIGVATALVFLRVNGAPLHVPGPELYALAMQVARNEIDEPAVAAWMRTRSQPLPPGNSSRATGDPSS
jgi:death-on-curing protein